MATQPITTPNELPAGIKALIDTVLGGFLLTCADGDLVGGQ